MRNGVGSSVLKIDGEYVTLDYPTQDQIASASATYLGGHIYQVTAEEAAELIAAGYEVEEV